MWLKTIILLLLNQITCGALNEDVLLSNKFKSTFIHLLQFNINLQTGPITVRWVTLERIKSTAEANVEYLQSDLINWMLHEEQKNTTKQYAYLMGNNKPFLNSSDENSITTGGIRGKIEMFRYLVIVYISDLNQQSSSLQDTVEQSINKRNDRSIFMVHTNDVVKKLSKLEVVQGLRDKYFIYLKSDPSNEVFTDPVIFDANDKAALISVPSVTDLPVRKKMGGLLRGRHLKTGQSEVFHWAYIQSREENGKVNFAGSFIHIQMESMKRFNYTLDIEFLDTYAALVNGTWIGSTGCVLNGDCDLSICLSPEYLWGSQMDFSPWIDTARLIFWTNYPRKDPKWFGFLLPFTPLVWLCLFLICVLFNIVLLAIMYFKGNHIWTRSVLETGIEMPFAIFLEQGVSRIPSGVIRYLMGMWLFAAIIIGTGYKSTLRKNLIFPPEDIVPRTHSQLAERKDYKSILYSFGELEVEHFRGSTDPKIQKIYKRLQIIDDRMECLYSVVLNYKQTCSSWYPPSAMLVAKYLTLSALFDPIIHSKDHIALSYMTLAFPKDSILVDTFSEIISGITETGVYLRFAEEEANKLKKSGVDYWKTMSEDEKEDSQIYQVLKKQVDTRDDSNTKALAFTSLCVVFLFVPIGGTVAFMAYVFEKMYFIRRTKEEERNRFDTPVISLMVREQQY